MKCIKNVETREITRVTDTKAQKMVSSEKWEFCPKKEWKDGWRKFQPKKVTVCDTGK